MGLIGPSRGSGDPRVRPTPFIGRQAPSTTCGLPVGSLCWHVGVPQKLCGLRLTFGLRILVSASGFVGSLGLELICFWMWAL